MAMEKIYRASYILVILASISMAADITVNLEVKEESQNFTTIGNLHNHLPAKMRQQGGILLFQDLKSEPFFNVKDTGDVQVAGKIDLETLCSRHKKCCSKQRECIITYRVLVTDESSKNMKSVDINIKVDDINDNKPMFSTDTQVVRVSESKPPGSQFSLSKATDADSSAANKILRYTLLESTGTFELVQDQNRLELRIKSPLDYETKKNYRGELQACDKDNCARQELIIEIVDENDNKPQFVQRLYNISLSESAGIGIVLRLQATDKDSGMYGQITYQYDGPASDDDLKNTFKVIRETGEIQLRERLSARTREEYVFKVAAVDTQNSVDTGRKDVADVIIKVVDVNDFAPVINIISPRGPISIDENKVPNALVATINAIDLQDLGDNAKVKCDLSEGAKRAFRLDLASAEVYTLHTIKTFNYEYESSTSPTIKCWDLGKPSQTTMLTIPININDENEFNPTFETNIYTASVEENTGPGNNVLKLSAKDDDGSDKITYSLDKQGQQYFTVDSKSGQIKTNKNLLDREAVERVTFKAFAIDSIKNPRTATVSVQVDVKDANDNAPVFVSPTGFEQMEEQSAFTQFGQLEATDADKDENGRVQFNLMHSWGVGHNGKHFINGYFRVVQDGKIETLRRLDREMYSEFILQVAATDQGRSPLSTMSNVTVTVLDINDNSPEWVYPKDRDNTINITSSMEPGEMVVRVRASDKDAEDNSRIQFLLLPDSQAGIGGLTPLFVLNTTTGSLLVDRTLSPGQYRLRLRATDQGRPPKFAESWLNINVYGADVAALNFTIIVVMVTATAVISIFLVVAIICVRRRPPRYSNPPESDFSKPPWVYDLPEEQQMQGYGMGGGGSYIAGGGGMGDSGSVIYMPSGTMLGRGGGMDNGDGMMSGTMTGAMSMQQDEAGVPLHTFNQNQSRCCGDGAVSRFPNELDRDSADSGRGGSEDDHGHHLLNGGDPNKNRPFSPTQFHGRPPPGPGSRLMRGRVSSPVPHGAPPGSTYHPTSSAGGGGGPGACYILPEDGVIQAGHSPYGPYGAPQCAPRNPGSVMGTPILGGNSLYGSGQIHPPPPPSYDTHSLPRSAGGGRRPYMPLSSGETSSFLPHHPQHGMGQHQGDYDGRGLPPAGHYGTSARPPRTPVGRRLSHDYVQPGAPPTSTTAVTSFCNPPMTSQYTPINQTASSQQQNPMDSQSGRNSPDPLPAPPVGSMNSTSKFTPFTSASTTSSAAPTNGSLTTTIATTSNGGITSSGPTTSANTSTFAGSKHIVSTNNNTYTSNNNILGTSTS